ncbi:D-alanyl-D-alanine carboxypeptidase DacC [termite gut metagenome]|uniref:D-alanyl-D-alanine carboxypeptidase DacC n=1 Tax=termite gut metagenome TaxID=433724 RepID=A0A5J4SVJ5_9ZZZZ
MKKTYLLACFLLFACLSVVRGQQDLAAQLNFLVKNNLPPGSDVGISVYDLTDGRSLYTYHDDKLSRPASTMKLLTCITALSQPDSEKPFSTEVWYKGYIKQNTLYGDIYVVGGFDPEFDDVAMNALVDSISRFPFSSIQGSIYGDVSMKDSLYWGNGWVWDDNPESFQPYLSPLMYHKGFVKVTVTPNSIKGGKATIECEPNSSFYTIRNETISHGAEAGKFSVSRNWLKNENEIIISGNVESKQTGEVNMHTSQDFFMHTFVERLRKKGMNVPETYIYSEFIPDVTAVCMAYRETPIQAVLNQLLKESDNLNGEALLYKLGAQYVKKKRVSAADGIKVITNMMEHLGHSPQNYRIADGSGLSNYNYVSPALLVDFLKYAYSDTEIFQKIYEALPVAGVDGTLKNRMKKGKAYRNIHAKTGTFTGISCLAGYVRTSYNHFWAFAIMNQNTLSASKARALQDMICEELAQ